VALETVIARVLEKSGGTDRLLLFVHQFEELFNKSTDEDRRSFVSMLLRTLARAPLTVLIALRASFYTYTIESSRELSDHIERGLVNLGPPTREELRRAVLEPARRVAISFEAGLVERILDDLEGEPGNLSLLEFALTRLWDKRQDRVLTHAAYDEVRTVAGAIAQRAEEVFQSLSPERQLQARRVFTRLWALSGPDGREDTRQRSVTAELGQAYWPVIKALADARLVVTGIDAATGLDTVEIAHDALNRDWERLKSWLAEDRDFLLWRARLREGVAYWESTGAGEVELLRGRPLEEARGWRERRAEELTSREVEFIHQSARFLERELVRTVKRRGWLLFGSAAVTAVVLALGAASVLFVAMHAFSAMPTPEAENALRRALSDSRIRRVLRGHTNVITSLAVSAGGERTATGRLLRELGGHAPVRSALFSPDGQRVVALGQDGVARGWDVGSGTMVLETRGPVDAAVIAAWSPDARLLLSTGADGAARLWNVESGRAIGLPFVSTGGVLSVAVSHDGSMATTGGADGVAALWETGNGTVMGRLQNAGSGVIALAFSPDSRLLAVGFMDGSIRLWNTRSRESSVAPDGHAAAVTRIVFGPDGTRLASGGHDNSVAIWDAADGKSLKPLHRLIRHTDSVYDLAFSADGRLLASAGYDGIGMVWDVGTGRGITELRGHTDALSGVLFSPDRSSAEIKVITISRDRSARVWAAVTGQDWSALRGHVGAVAAVAFSPDGSHVVTAGADNSARIWSLGTRQTEQSLRGHRDSLEVARFSPDGSVVVTASRDATAQVWDASTGRQLAVLRGHADSLRDARFSPDGRRIVTASNDATARVWDASSGNPRPPLPAGHADRVYAAVFSPDGRLVATGSADRSAMIWDLVSGSVLPLKGHRDGVRHVAFSPDGRHVATASDDGTARVWQSESGTLVGELKGHEAPVGSVEFSRDGKWLVTASWDGTARIWDATSHVLRHALKRHRGKLSAAVFSPDGKWVATGGWDSTGYIWNAATGEVARDLSGHHDRILGVAFSPDGRLVATASRDETVRLWAVDAGTGGDAYACNACAPTAELLAIAKRQVTRELSSLERKEYLGE